MTPQYLGSLIIVRVFFKVWGCNYIVWEYNYIALSISDCCSLSQVTINEFLFHVNVSKHVPEILNFSARITEKKTM